MHLLVNITNCNHNMRNVYFWADGIQTGQTSKLPLCRVQSVCTAKLLPFRCSMYSTKGTLRTCFAATSPVFSCSCTSPVIHQPFNLPWGYLAGNAFLPDPEELRHTMTTINNTPLQLSQPSTKIQTLPTWTQHLVRCLVQTINAYGFHGSNQSCRPVPLTARSKA